MRLYARHSSTYMLAASVAMFAAGMVFRPQDIALVVAGMALIGYGMAWAPWSLEGNLGSRRGRMGAVASLLMFGFFWAVSVMYAILAFAVYGGADAWFATLGIAIHTALLVRALAEALLALTGNGTLMRMRL